MPNCHSRWKQLPLLWADSGDQTPSLGVFPAYCGHEWGILGANSLTLPITIWAIIRSRFKLILTQRKFRMRRCCIFFGEGHDTHDRQGAGSI
jgi:hypothetical protein